VPCFASLMAYVVRTRWSLRGIVYKTLPLSTAEYLIEFKREPLKGQGKKTGGSDKGGGDKGKSPKKGKPSKDK